MSRPRWMRGSLFDAIKASKNGMSRTEIIDFYGRNTPKAEIDLELMRLYRAGLVGYDMIPTAGRPIERWRCVR